MAPRYNSYRRRNTRRTWVRRSYQRRPRLNKYRRQRPVGGRIYDFVRSFVSVNAIALTNTIDTLTGFQYALNQLPNYTEFTSLYDEYRIKYIKVEFLPKFDSVVMPDVTGVTNTARMGYLFSAVDYDDSSSPSSLETILQYQTMKRTKTSDVHSRYWSPCTAKEYYVSGVSSGYGREKAPWLDCESVSVPHYGLKIAGQLPGPGTVYYDAHVTYHLQFRGVR